jgi:hypothetical protein
MPVRSFNTLGLVNLANYRVCTPGGLRWKPREGLPYSILLCSQVVDGGPEPVLGRAFGSTHGPAMPGHAEGYRTRSRGSY